MARIFHFSPTFYGWKKNELELSSCLPNKKKKIHDDLLDIYTSSENLYVMLKDLANYEEN